MPEAGRYFNTTATIDTIVYAVVRHPQSGLSWIVINLAMMLVAQHWLVVVLGGGSIVAVYLSTREEHKSLVRKSGEEYTRYARSVPAANVL